MIRHARTALLLTAAVLLLAACSGWQLRGQTSTPELESITLDGASARLRYTLEDELEPSGVLIHGESQNIVMILDERWDSRTAAVDARGRAAERAEQHAAVGVPVRVAFAEGLTLCAGGQGHRCCERNEDGSSGADHLVPHVLSTLSGVPTAL